jgi:hypothetical protein
MALASIQALYDDDDDHDHDNEDEINTTEEETNDRMAVITDPTFSVMSKIKLNLTPAIAIQVRKIVIFLLIHSFFLFKPVDTSSFLDIKTREVLYNPKYDDMYAPVVSRMNL